MLCVCALGKCNVCGLDVPILYTCERCGNLYCFYCGDLSKRRCVKCLTEEEGDVFDREDWLVTLERFRT
jgi:hypothetical protein